MSKLETELIDYKGHEYVCAWIPDVLADMYGNICIGCHSLNEALYDNEKGYPDEEAKVIDETIYAYIDDEYFNLSYEEFIEKVIKYLD